MVLRRWTAAASGSTLWTGGKTHTAKVTFGPNITDARGKISEVVYYRNHFGAATRAWVAPAQPNTDRQLTMQQALAAALLRWQTNLTDAQRRAWEQFTRRFLNTTPINGPKPLAGVGKYVSLNLFSFLYGGVHIDDPPANQDVTQPQALALVTNNATGMAADGFNRVDSDDLGADWEVNPALSFQIVSEQVAPKAPVNWSAAKSLVTTFDDDQISRALLSDWPGATQYIGPAVRVTAATRSGYLARIDPDQVLLVRMVNNVGTEIGVSPPDPILGATYELEVVGTTLNVRENGVTIIGPVTDATIASGAPGLFSLGAGTDVRLDNWLGKNHSAPEPLTISLANPGLAGEVLVVRATRALSAGILNFNAWLKVIGFYPAPVSYPLDIFWDWKNTYDKILIPPPAPPDPPATQAGTLVTGKRIGITAYFVRIANGAASQALSAQSITT